MSILRYVDTMWSFQKLKQAPFSLLIFFVAVPSYIHCQIPPVYYQFGYQVDTPTGDYHGHMEQLDGVKKTGEFKVRLPDGRLQIVTYQADEYGFRPKIHYEIDPEFIPPPPPGELPLPPLPNEIQRPSVMYVTPKPGYKSPSPSPSPRPNYRPPPPNLTPSVSPPPLINYDPRPKPKPSRYTPPNDHYEAPPVTKPKYKPGLELDLALAAAKTQYQLPKASYSPPKESYVPPSSVYTPPKIQYDSYVPPPPIINYTPREEYSPPPQHHQAHRDAYSPPKTPAKSYLTPVVDYLTNNYVDTSRHYSPVIERHDMPEEDATSRQEYFLVPIRGEEGSKPILALLVKKRQ